MSKILDKPTGFRRSSAQMARNLEALAKLREGALKKGELFRLVSGAAGPRRSTRRHPGGCLDCGESIHHGGPPFKSQPRRCRPCGRAKRQKHNQTQKEKNYK